MICIPNRSSKDQSFIYIHLSDQAVLFQTIQFCISTQFTCQRFYLTLSGATSPNQNGCGSDGREWVPHIPQISSIIEASPSDCLVSYPGELLVGSLNPIQKCCQCILQQQLTSHFCWHGMQSRWPTGSDGWLE